MKFLVFLISIALMSFSLIAKAEFCGICKDGYLSCAASGKSLDRCKAEMNSCNNACYGTGSSDSSSNKDGIGQWIAGLILGVVGGIALAFIADTVTSNPIGQYKFYRGAVILFGCLAVALCLALISKMHASEKEILPYMIWTLSTIFVAPVLILRWLKPDEAKKSLPKEDRDSGVATTTADIATGAPPSSGYVAEKSTSEVLSTLGARIETMTVAEISKETGKTERGIRTYLTRHGINAKDYEGASKKAKAMGTGT